MQANATITPFLTVGNAGEASLFYQNGFGAIQIKKHELADHKHMFLLSAEGAEFWIGDEEPQFGNIRPSGTPASSLRMILQTANADDIYARAINAGAQSICPMTTEEEWRIGKLMDPFGHIWEIGYIL